MPILEGMALGWVVSALANAATSSINAYLQRKQTRELSKENRQLTIDMERDRQGFQLSMHEQNAELQKSLCAQNHHYRLHEQQINFENMCKSAEWNRFLDVWPFITLPSVIREELIMPDNSVCLRVFFTRNADQLFNKIVYPQIEQGLREFVDIYHNHFQSKNVIFYHNAYKSTFHGGGVEENLFYALKELPVLIIDTNLIGDKISVSLTVWGFGSNTKNHMTVFSVPYKQSGDNGKIDIDYYSDISNTLLSYLKFILGYTYDAYNLIQYDKSPLLPKVALFEKEHKVGVPVLSTPETIEEFGNKYLDMYDLVLGDVTAINQNSTEKSLSSYKSTYLHKLRIDYANVIKEYISDKDYRTLLDQSLESWVALRSMLPANLFLQDIISDTSLLSKFFSMDDKEYWKKISIAYADILDCTDELVQLVLTVNEIVSRDAEYISIPIDTSMKSSLPAALSPKKKKYVF